MLWRNEPAYGQDLRDRVPVTPGVLCQVAERFGLSQTFVCPARAYREKLGQASPGALCNHRSLRPSDIMVVNHFSAHKVAGIQATIEWVSAPVNYLPPFSPDDNPARPGVGGPHAAMKFRARSVTSAGLVPGAYKADPMPKPLAPAAR